MLPPNYLLFTDDSQMLSYVYIENTVQPHTYQRQTLKVMNQREQLTILSSIINQQETELSSSYYISAHNTNASLLRKKKKSAIFTRHGFVPGVLLNIDVPSVLKSESYQFKQLKEMFKVHRNDNGPFQQLLKYIGSLARIHQRVERHLQPHACLTVIYSVSDKSTLCFSDKANNHRQSIKQQDMAHCVLHIFIKFRSSCVSLAAKDLNERRNKSLNDLAQMV